jgi:hypothetical protein
MPKNRFFAIPALLALALAAGVPAAAQTGKEKQDRVDRASLEKFVADRQAVQEAERQATVDRAAELGLPLRWEGADGTIIELYKFTPEGRPLYRITDNLNAARTVSTDDVWSGGSAGLALTGAGQQLGIWDGGSVRIAHQEFGGRATLFETVGLSDHSTHVAGTMIASGVDANARGMAGAAAIRSWDFNNDETEMAAAQIAATPPVISNHSYGFITGWRQGSFGCSNGLDPQWYWFGDVTVSTQEDLVFGLYEDSSEAWDQIAFDSQDYLIFKSAGNDRGEGPATTPANHCHWNGTLAGGAGDFEPGADSHPQDGAVATGFDTIGGGAGSAKNIMTIGAVNDIPGGYVNPASVVMSGFSGWGPVDDGRIKPDVVANGVSLRSSTTASNTAYGNLSGTSMSTPNASGSVALIRHHAANLGQTWRGATYKAVAIHSADEAGANPGPDYTFGWGLLNTTKAAAVLTAEAAAEIHVIEDNLVDGGSVTYTVPNNPGDPLRVTLVWTDPAGTPAGFTTLDPPTLRLVNDLDLSISGPGGSIHFPWVLDPANPATAATTGDNDRDNVEQVLLATPTAGVYFVTVNHEGSITSGPQNFSLIITGNRPIGIFEDGFEAGNTSAWSSTVP